MPETLSLALCKPDEMARLREQLGQPGLMGRSIESLRVFLEPHLAKPSDIPGHGEAGSYAHNQHQLNYRLCETAGTLFQITGEQCYADLAADLLTRYADCYLGLGFQKAKNTNPAGRIFHQILNENIWLLSMSIGYGSIRHTLSAGQCAHIEQQLLRPAVVMMTELYAHDFATIHNHGLWGVAAVGTCGLVIGDERYVQLALDGLAGDRKTGGYLAEISLLFAPSGYYIEGPYYHRFAMRALLLFAEALHTHRPDLDIYNFNDQVIRTTIRALLAVVTPNGCLPALNDASRTMGIHDEGLLIAAAVYNARYGDDPAVFALARQQGQVWVHPAALGLAAAADALQSDALPFWPSVELNEGPAGDKGAQGILRAKASDGDISQVLMNYGQHGMDHGHFDTLGITLFNRGEEVLREYGFARWLNVEPKFGGRYLPENLTWARQTVAHNCVTVDGRSQNDGDRNRADQVHGLPHFFVGSGAVQAMSAMANDHFVGVAMQRSLLLVTHEKLDTPVLVDLYRLRSDTEHVYDYAVQYAGQITETSAPVDYNRSQWTVLGEASGYQHLMGVANSRITEPCRITWLQGKRFNSWLSAATSGELLFGQLGGNDASFNLRRDTTLILRQRGSKHLFASAFETHGLFDEPSERCHGARGELTQIRVVGHDDQGSVVELTGRQLRLLVMVSNRADVTAQTEHEVRFDGTTYRWTGFFACEAVA
ncbi:heparinase II/III domain-containing protein [Piscinibacter sakaiensis]|uniref:heparinase II/III domain-containing protein n=1 Tax=Piscinibacter sakaiensis TaxID=1547922 RepID=UPI003AABE6A6